MIRLPKTITIPEQKLSGVGMEELADSISDYLSDTYGFCHKGFDLEIKVKNIKWDTED